MPTNWKLVLATLVLLSWIPLLWGLSARMSKSEEGRIHLWQHMDNQDRFEAQAANPLFEDGRADRLPVPGTVARGELMLDDGFYRGMDGDRWMETLPAEVSGDVPALMERGREQYGVFCSTCHGAAGYGDGPTHTRVMELKDQPDGGTHPWTPPSSYHSEIVRSRPLGHLFNTISQGMRNMPGLGTQIPVADRWAIVAYVRTLMRSQHAMGQDLPAGIDADALREAFRDAQAADTDNGE